jgi:hypothetical protein
VQIDQIARQTLNERRDILPVAEHGVARPLDARRQSLRALHPLLVSGAVHFQHLRLDVLGDQRARRALGDDAAVVHDREAVAQALGLFHEVRGEHERLAFLRQAAQPLPDQVARLRVEAGGRLVHENELRVVHQRARQRQAALHAAGERADLGVAAPG